jgi:hypothetical protein
MGMMRMAGSILRFKPRTPRHSWPKSQGDLWNEFFNDAELLARHQVTAEELIILRDFSPLGAITCTGDILFILSTIRWANRKPGS